MKVLPIVFTALMCGCAFASEADNILEVYYKAVAEQVGKDPQALGMAGVLEKYEELGQKLLLTQKVVLHQKAVADYGHLPLLKEELMKDGQRIAWKEAKQFNDGNVVHPDSAKDELDQVVLLFSDSGYGIPPFDKTVVATTWWDPIKAARTLRELAYRRKLPQEEIDRRKFVEQYSPPIVYRTGTNAEKPGIAFFDGNEVFLLELTYLPDGVYALSALKWIKCP